MKILIGLDGSTHSLVARDLVAGLRWPPDTTVYLVGAYQLPIDWTGGFGAGMDWVGDVEDAVRDDLLEQLRTAGEPLESVGLGVERVALRARAADALLDTAAKVGADLIVTGSRGLGPLRAMLLGSVAAEVAGSAPCPVLVARSPQVGRMLVATDGSESASEIVERFGAWGAFAGIPTDVVAVFVPDGPAFSLMVSLYSRGDDRLEQERAKLTAKAAEDADDMAARLVGIGIPAQAHPRRGDPAAEIAAAAQEHGADLVVTGSRGLGGIDRLLLGSVARNVLSHTHCSVLIVRKEA